MKWFGKDWSARICQDSPRAETPVGKNCVWCEEQIGENDRGFIRPDGNVAHLECDLRSVIGGINHQRGICSCCGGTENPDPPNLTRRQAAKAAMDFYWEVTLQQRSF